MPPVTIFEALSDPTRCRILELLRQGPLSVHVLASSFTISRPAISRHLRVLKRAKLISEKKIGRENLYRLHIKRLEPGQTWLATMMSPATPVPAKSMPEGRLARPAQANPSTSQIGFDF
jgi:DNA-binding transcriptional ArsR family regulator